MPPIQDQHDVFDELDEIVERTFRPRRRDHSADVYGVIGVIVLMTMLLIATGTIPLYDWAA
jgi:hypothetical protein